MASKPSALEHLAKVFLSGFRLDGMDSIERRWEIIRAEYDALSVTLVEDEAEEFRRIVERLLNELTAP